MASICWLTEIRCLVRPSCEDLPKAPELAELERGVGSSNRKSILLTGLNFEPAVVVSKWIK